MTAQLPKKKLTTKQTEDASFMLRWLNGTLQEEELTSLRNREEYEEMMALDDSNSGPLFSNRSKAISLNADKDVRSATPTNPITFVTFAFVAVVVFLIALLVFKFNW